MSIFPISDYKSLLYNFFIMMNQETDRNNYKFTIAAAPAKFEAAGKTTEQIIDICRKSGSSGLEGNTLLFEGKTISELEKTGREFRNAGLIIQTFHLPYQDPVKDDIAALYETDRMKAETNIKRWIEKASALGAEIGIIHPTSRKGYDVNIEGIDRINLQADKTIQSLLKFSEQFNFKIALENMLPYSGGRFGCEIIHMTELFKRNKHKNLGFCMDTGHALVASGEKAMDVFHAFKDHLIALHLADNGGDRDSHLAPGHGNFFWKDFFSELGKINFQNTVCIEAPPFSFGPDYSVESWKKMINDTKKLAEI